MTPDQLNALRSVTQDFMIGATTGADRTLIYGYDTDRRYWHVYQKGGWLYRVIYIGSNPGLQSGDTSKSFDTRSLVPNKRLYPEACDFIFCFELVKRGISLPFLAHGTMRIDPNEDFFGRLL